MRPLLWKPLLAVSLPLDPATGDFRWDLIRFPVWASPKLDGYRAMVQRGTQLDRCVVGKDCRVKTDAAIFDGIIVSPFRRE